MAHYAERNHVDAVLCGHIHRSAIREIGNVTYYNCGDWVESCTALVEENDGNISVLNYLPRVHAESPPARQELITASFNSALKTSDCACGV